MGKPRPTSTINRLHFEDMENRRFEDLAQSIVHKLRDWIELSHIGRPGKDEGVDIEAVENDDGTRKRWVIQCKRYKSFALSEATASIDEAVKDGQQIDVMLLVVGCDVTKATRVGARAHAASRGIADFRIWDASYVQSTLYNDRKDLLFIYFGIDIKGDVSRREATVKRRNAMRERLKRQFTLTPKDRAARQKRRDAWEWNEPTVVIRDVNDETYPECGPSSGSISPWFKCQPLDFYHNGIRIVLTARSALLYEDGTWEIVTKYGQPSPDGAKEFTVYILGKIPLDNIVDFTKSSDEYGYGPTIFCRFANGGEPYEVIEYAFMYGDNDGFPLLDASLQRLPLQESET